jgi:transcriptional regulator with XRE-family HTH domain
MIIVPAQIRAARALLGWSQERLAVKASVALTTIRDVENQRRSMSAPNVSRICAALQNAGIRFLPSSGTGGPGVALRKKLRIVEVE